ncbi:SDR family NAD(P)-dependent oxidoreductase [Pseudonocardia asaccharolytica]|uniref:2-hydroxycyclohexanecarboxyl-CoA dehydrogenase n=1 Tax=Pseudonocardia asaccharolytica DSM 44247 = NBRC 16224 TaxID=1123024 RepID=A0A511D0T2_9PSEU|nr:3-oxoacyl-ACP reductase family protein [Pseudonocardia asaccharolytica]GEL17154.1 2-hydroxycyclohexanecarboxyl-CoA dehydrogenase [Pseudonocardia asaccharolytica DSM 44247 = NBRC 16224]
MSRLTGSVVIVTGGGRGIGESICTELASQGADVAVADLDERAAATVAACLAQRYGVHTLGVGADVTDPGAVRAVVDAAESELGPVTGLVNNAGIDVIGRFVDSTPDTWDRLIDVNLKGTIGVTRAVLDGMIARSAGRIVNIASDAGRVGSSGEVVYSATKGGVIAFSKALAREVAKEHITVNVVCPGPTDTALLDQVAEASQKLYDGLARAVPMRRIAQPADIAPAVAFLLSPGAGYITGQTLSVSGGLTMV